MKSDTLIALCDRLYSFVVVLPDCDTKQRLNNMLCVLIDSDFPDLKIGKWLGYIEGCLITAGLTTIDAERDFTRPLMHQHYIDSGINIPDSIDVMK